MRNQENWDALRLQDLPTTDRTPRRQKRKAGRRRKWLDRVRQCIGWITDFAAAPIVVTAMSGAVRGEAFDRWVFPKAEFAWNVIQTWLAEQFFRESSTDFMRHVAPAGFVGVGIFLLAASLIRVKNYTPSIVLSEIARRQGRTTSTVDLVIASSLPISLTLSIAQYGAISAYALGWFYMAYFFCRISFNPKRVRGFLDWVMRIRGPLGALGIETGELDDADQDS